jgi:hypothetical protein
MILNNNWVTVITLLHDQIDRKKITKKMTILFT